MLHLMKSRWSDPTSEGMSSPEQTGQSMRAAERVKEIDPPQPSQQRNWLWLRPIAPTPTIHPRQSWTQSVQVQGDSPGQFETRFPGESDATHSARLSRHRESHQAWEFQTTVAVEVE